ncbi:MAG: S9 family peptidase [Candidatus Sphingomonas colombiensis]|nr:S9 family peptidase [Sphingomonas sp.]WEK43782.1 MAG: S9 family peptidase [Sphingomonas sp.]
MRKSVYLAGIALIAAPAQAEPSREAKAFGAREYIQDISLSPDGKKVAMIQADGARGAVLTVADFSSAAPKPILRTSGMPEQLQYCRWTTPSRLICRADLQIQSVGRLIGFSRMVALNDDGSGLKELTKRPDNDRALRIMQFGGSVIDWTGDGKGAAILMMRDYVPETTIGTNVKNERDGRGVDLVDTVSLGRKTVEQPRSNAVEYISDGLGDVRILGTRGEKTSGYSEDSIAYSFRKRGERNWQPLGKYRLGLSGGAGFNPIAVDSALDAVYGFDDADGRQALYRMSLDGNFKKDLVFAHPEVDVDDLIRIGRQRRVVGVSWTTDQRHAEFFDSELAKLRTALGKAIPNAPLIRFIDSSADEKQLLLNASSDNDPGRYYLFDKATRTMGEVMPARPQLADMTLAKMKPVSYRAADGTMVPGYLTLPVGSTGKNLPTIVMPHGGPGYRDEWGFDWLAQFFAARGFAVLQPNFRGSSGYGDAWFKKNGFQSWRTAIGDVNDGGRWLVQQGIADPGKLAIVGWSYGGYAALQSAVLDGNLFKAIVAIAPVTDLESLRSEARDYTSFPLVDRFIGNGPHVREGSPARNVEAIKAPVLLFHGDQDANVRIAESRLMAGKLRDAGKPVELVEFKGLDHQLDDSAARTEMLDKADTFLRASLHM